MGEIVSKIHTSIISAGGLYHRLVLLVGQSGSGKTATLRLLADEFKIQLLNINLELSSAMLELSSRQRSIRVSQLLEKIVDKYGSLVLLDNLEILFDKTLNQDPLRLLQGLSRNRIVVASWNGIMNSRRLLYAETGHPEYRSYDLVDALIVGMDGTATVDSAKNNRKAGQA